MPRVQFTEGWDSFDPQTWTDKAETVVGDTSSNLFRNARDAIYYRQSIQYRLDDADSYLRVANILNGWQQELFGYWQAPDFTTIENPALALGKLARYLLTYDVEGDKVRHAMLCGLMEGVTIEEHLFTFHEMIDALEIDRVRQEMEAERQRRIREQNSIEANGRELHPTEGYRVHHRRLRKQLEDAGIEVVSREVQDYADNTVSTSNEGIVYKSVALMTDGDINSEYQKAVDILTTICTMLYENGYRFRADRSFWRDSRITVSFRVTGFIDPALHRDVKNCSAEFTEWLEEQVNERVERRQPVTV